MKVETNKDRTTDSFRNFSNEVSLNRTGKSENIILSVGDEIKIGKYIYYINSFLGKNGKYIPSKVELEREDGKIQLQPFNRRFVNIVADYITKTNNEYEFDINGFKLKVGEIIIIEEPVRKIAGISKVRKSRDGKIEVKINSDYYLLDNIKFSIFDKNNVIYCGLKLEIGKQYFVLKHDSNSLLYKDLYGNGSRVFNNVIMNNDNSQIMLSFGDLSINFDDDSYNIINEESCKNHKMVRSFNSLIIGDFYKSNIVHGLSLSWYNSQELQQSIFKSDDEIEIIGTDFDINFKVDDFVVMIAWTKDNPISAPLKITGFKIIEDLLCFDLISLDGTKTYTVPYIDFTNGSIFVGQIRKISLDCMGLRHGDEIQANISGVQNFPKKDVNRIVGVITDVAKTPLVLCSNYCTIWSTQIELDKFDIVSRNMSTWGKRLIAKPDKSKIKFQPGDFITYNYNVEKVLSFIVNDRSLFNDVKIQDGRMSNRLFRSDSYTTISGDWNFYGLLSPRYSRKEHNSMVSKKIIPNMFNGYSQTNSRYSIKEIWDYV